MELISVTEPGTKLTPSLFTTGCALLVDKPKEWTSFDVVNKVRGTLRHAMGIKKIKVGHSGTLDPMASGLLLLCVGPYTKRLGDLQGLDKEYTGTMRLGATTASYDAETPVERELPVDHIEMEEVRSAMEQLTGNIAQVPPIYSAIKLQGTPLYKLARKGKTAEIEPRDVTIQSFNIVEYDKPDVDFKVHCSKGTYIRSLVHDAGQILGCGAYLTALRRTKIGEYDIREAWNLDELVGGIKSIGEGTMESTVS